MGEPFVGEIRIFAGSFAPSGWAFCDGSPLPISENDTLFNLIGTTYGGDGQTTFNLPDLRGRVPIHQGQGQAGNYVIGEAGGVESVTLSSQQIPAHNHTMMASTDNGQQPQPTGGYLAQTNPGFPYVAVSQPFVQLNSGAAAPVGGSQPHENMAPSLVISYIISLFGVYPQQG